ncbi:hypothetical protein ACEPAF_2457 [Sanghuangporus sanghuang]
MTETLVVSDGGPSSNALHGILLCIAAEAMAALGFLVSIFRTAITPQPVQPPMIENFVIRYRDIAPQAPPQPTYVPSRRPSLPRSKSENTIREIKGRPRASSDPTGTTSRPDLFRTRAALRARRCMSIAGAAAAKTAIPARPIVKGARTVLRTLSVNEGVLGKQVEDDEEDDEEEEEKMQQSATPAFLKTAHFRTKNALNRSATVATAAFVAVKAPIAKGFANPVVHSEEKPAQAGVLVVEELPEHGKRQRKFCSALFIRHRVDLLVHSMTRYTAEARCLKPLDINKHFMLIGLCEAEVTWHDGGWAIIRVDYAISDYRADPCRSRYLST